MKTIAVVSQKGGAGKTTVAIHLAVASVQAGRNTAIVDLDPQASATNWRDRRAADVPVVISAHASRLRHEMQRAKESGGEVVFIDTAPHADGAALEAAKAADLVLIPCRPAILDLEALANTLQLVRVTKTPVLIVLNAVAAAGTEAAEAAEAIAGLDAEVCPAQLGNRVAFSRSLISGRTAQEIEPEAKAAREVERLHAFMCEHMGMS